MYASSDRTRQDWTGLARLTDLSISEGLSPVLASEEKRSASSVATFYDVLHDQYTV